MVLERGRQRERIKARPMTSSNKTDSSPGSNTQYAPDVYLRFIDACREVQTQATLLSGDENIPPNLRDALRDLRLLLLSTRKAFLESAGHPMPTEPEQEI